MSAPNFQVIATRRDGVTQVHPKEGKRVSKKDAQRISSTLLEMRHSTEEAEIITTDVVEVVSSFSRGTTQVPIKY